MLHGTDGEVETVVDDQAVRLGRRREGRKHLGRADGEEREEQATEHRHRAHGCDTQPSWPVQIYWLHHYLGRVQSTAPHIYQSAGASLLAPHAQATTATRQALESSTGASKSTISGDLGESSTVFLPHFPRTTGN